MGRRRFVLAGLALVARLALALVALMKLKRFRQCKACPWKVSTDPVADIPNYQPAMHAALANTIANPMGPWDFNAQLSVFSCHEHAPGEDVACVGWLMNQLEDGNNIPLRFDMRDCENLDRVRLDGPQHATFADTLPKG